MAKALLRRVALALWSLRAEILLSVALCGGWAALTWGVAALLVWQVWPISFGILLLSAVGWKLLRTLALEGLYALTRRGRSG